MQNNKFYLAAKRLNMLLSGASHDIFAADIFYHRSCYRNYVRTKEQSVDQEKEKLKIQKDNIFQVFFSKIRLKIRIDKEAYMLKDLLKDIEVISNSHGVETVVKQTVELRRLLTSKFGKEICFFPSGKYRIVHASDINRCEYCNASKVWVERRRKIIWSVGTAQNPRETRK